MSNVDMCEHDWPGTGCRECMREAHKVKISELEDSLLDQIESKMLVEAELHELSLKTEARIEELEDQLKESEKTAWEHFYIHQEVFNYLISQGYIDEVVEGDAWEAAAQNIINGIKNIERKLK